MNDIRLLVSACGAPGCSTLIRYLRGIKERNLYVVGIDSDEEAVGRFLSNKFYKVPLASHEDYINSVYNIIKQENINVFYCVSSAEIPIVAAHKEYLEEANCVVMASEKEEISTAENKAKLYNTLSQYGIPTPEYRIVKSLSEFIEAVKDLGYPNRQICFKPPVSKGSRGFRILNESINRKDLLLYHKPESLYMSIEEFKRIFEDDHDFPEFVVMEVVEGINYDAMALCGQSGALLITIKTRESSRWGVINKGELVNSQDHMKLVKKIINAIPLRYNICLQFIKDKIIEINPRPSTFIYQYDLNEPYLAIKLALGEVSEEEIRSFQEKIEYGRRMVRYMDQVFFLNNEIDHGPFHFIP